MKIVKSSYKINDGVNHVNIHKKQFHGEKLHVGDQVYKKDGAGYDTEVGVVTSLLHNGRCVVSWGTDADTEICQVEDLMTVKKYNDFYNRQEQKESITAAEEYDSTMTTKYDGTKYMIHYTNVDIEDSDALFHDWKEQITEIHPYDDAEYYWARIDQGTIDYIYRGKIRSTEYYLTPEDEDIDNYDYMDEISLRAIERLHDLNKGISPKMVHMSTDIKSTEAIGVQNFDEDVYASEYDEPIDVAFEANVYLDIAKADGVVIDVYDNGTWDYLDQSYAFAQNPESRDGDWYVTEDDLGYFIEDSGFNGILYDALVADYITVVEDFDELIESIIPRYSGRYMLSGTVQLIYDVDGFIYRETHGRRPRSEDDIDYYFDMNNCYFNKNKSKKKFKIAITEMQTYER